MTIATWVILPGFGLAPGDVTPLSDALKASGLPGSADVRVVDEWEIPLTSPADAIAEHLALTDAPQGSVGLLAHSLGGLAGIEWSLLSPAQIGALVVIDPVTPDGPDTHGAGLWRGVDHASGWTMDHLAGLAPGLGILGRSWLRALSGLGHDRLAADDLRRRFATAEGWHVLAADLTGGPAQNDRVADLLSVRGDRPFAGLPGLHLSCASTPLGRLYLDDQRHFAERLGLPLRVMATERHNSLTEHPGPFMRAVEDVVARADGSRTGGAPAHTASE